MYIRSGTFSQAASLGNIVLQSHLASTTPITKTSFEKYSVSKSRSIDGCRSVFSRNIDHNIVFLFCHRFGFVEDATDSGFEFSCQDALVLVCRPPRGPSRCVLCDKTKFVLGGLLKCLILDISNSHGCCFHTHVYICCMYTCYMCIC